MNLTFNLLGAIAVSSMHVNIYTQKMTKKRVQCMYLSQICDQYSLKTNFYWCKSIALQLMVYNYLCLHTVCLLTEMFEVEDNDVILDLQSDAFVLCNQGNKDNVLSNNNETVSFLDNKAG